MKHTDNTCVLCAQKLTQCHPYLKQWFYDIKHAFPFIHVSWSFRGQADQEEAFRTGHSKAQWPKSPHNHTENGTPMSLALDLFEQIDDKGVWSKDTFARIWKATKDNNYDIIWGHYFKSLGDDCHFQYWEKL